MGRAGKDKKAIERLERKGTSWERIKRKAADRVK